MTTTLVLIALVALLAASLRYVWLDPRGTLPPPASRHVDRRFLPPAAR